MKRSRKRIIFLIIAILLFISWVELLYFYSPEEIVNYFGVEGSFIGLFVLGVIAGITSFFAAPFYGALVTLAAGNLSIFYLVLIGATSLSMAQFIYYYFGLSSHYYLPENTVGYLNRMTSWMRKNQKLIPFLLIFYFAFTPLPNELLITPLGVCNYSFKRFAFLLLFGNFILLLLITLASRYGYLFFS